MVIARSRTLYRTSAIKGISYELDGNRKLCRQPAGSSPFRLVATCRDPDFARPRLKQLRTSHYQTVAAWCSIEQWLYNMNDSILLLSLLPSSYPVACEL